MAIDHITMLQIEKGLCRMYNVQFLDSNKQTYTYKFKDYIPFIDDDAVHYAVVHVHGALKIVKVLEDVTHKFIPEEQIIYNWLVDVISNYRINRQKINFRKDVEARNRLEHASAMDKVRALQREMNMDLLTGKMLEAPEPKPDPELPLQTWGETEEEESSIPPEESF